VGLGASYLQDDLGGVWVGFVALADRALELADIDGGHMNTLGRRQVLQSAKTQGGEDDRPAPMDPGCRGAWVRHRVSRLDGGQCGPAPHRTGSATPLVWGARRPVLRLQRLPADAQCALDLGRRTERRLRPPSNVPLGTR